ncbi:MAG: glycosyltransferase family 1 protein [Planctomycetota bacterium]
MKGKKRRIAINGLGIQRGGGLTSLLGLAGAIDSVDKKNAYLIFLHTGQRHIINSLPERFSKVVFPLNIKSLFLRLIVEQFVLPLCLLWYRVDCLYSGGNLTILFAPCKLVFLIENANPYSFLKLQRSKQETVRNIIIRFFTYVSAARADCIRFLSDDSRRLICNNYRIPADKSFVLPHGTDSKNISSEISTCAETGLSCRFILVVSDFYPHKNINNILEAFDILVEQFKYEGCLVIIGNFTYYNYNKYFKKVLKKIEGLKNGRKVILKGHVEHKQLYGFYKNADVFVYPSIEETFGIPLIEAMALKTPIAASDCSKHNWNYFNPFKEVCGDSAEYFDPLDAKDMARAIHKIATDTNCRERLIKNAADQIRRYDLKDIARQLVERFESV